MIILHRYIAKTIILATLLVLLAVVGIAFFISLLTELRDVGNGDYGLPQAVIHVLLKLPYDLYQFFPMLALLGGVLGLTALSSHHELVVMRTAGMSVQRIIGAVLTAGIILVIFATIVGEGFAPKALFMADKYKDSAENGGQAVATATGVWIHEGNNFVHIDRVMGRHHLEGVKRYEFDNEHKLLKASFAEKLDFEEGHWRWHNLSQTIFKNDRTVSTFNPTGTWDLALNPNLLSVGLVEPRELMLPNLANYSKHLVKNGLQATRFQFEFWKRIFQPFMTLVMILLAVPFVFAAPRSVGTGWRILLGVIIGFVFYILNAFLGQFSIVFQVSPFIAAVFPTVLFALVGYFFSRKVAN